MESWSGSEKSKRYIRKVYSDSGIERRHSVIADFGNEGADSMLFQRVDGVMKEPTTGDRNEIYVDAAKKMIPEIARNAIDNCPGVEREDITHVITVSCTGFFNPGPDLLVIESLDLNPAVERYNLGFMGCYAAFPALKMADQFCAADPNANVLIICLELCSLHLQVKDDLDSIVANSVFSDGAAAAIVSGTPPVDGSKAYEINHFASRLTRDGSADMAWDIGDRGFNIVLSKYVARIIGAEIDGIVSGIFESCDASPDEIDVWAVHPGGRAIVDKIQESLELDPSQVTPSRKVLSEYGNMSSATVLFVLREILESGSVNNGQKVCAIAFGPGLTIEASLLNAVVS